MDLREAFDAALSVVRESKEDTVQNHPDSPDMLSHIDVYRGDVPVATMGCAPDRDTQLFLLKMAIIGLKADQVVFSMETCHTTHMVNPGTGREWSSGEMTDVIRMEPKPDWWLDGMITEGIATFAWARDGEMLSGHQGFEIKGDKVIWLEGEGTLNPSLETKTFGGFLTEEISMYWHDTPFIEAATKEAPEHILRQMADADPEEINAYTDLAVVAHIKRMSEVHGLPAFCGLFADPDPENPRTKILLGKRGLWDEELSHGPDGEKLT